jgi:hypothetical protein
MHVKHATTRCLQNQNCHVHYFNIHVNVHCVFDNLGAARFAIVA